MQKIQLSLPNPLMVKIRSLSQREDRSVSEIIIRAVEAWLERSPVLGQGGDASNKKVPVFEGGEVLLDSKSLRDMIYGKKERE